MVVDGCWSLVESSEANGVSLRCDSGSNVLVSVESSYVGGVPFRGDGGSRVLVSIEVLGDGASVTVSTGVDIVISLPFLMNICHIYSCRMPLTLPIFGIMFIMGGVTK